MIGLLILLALPLSAIANRLLARAWRTVETSPNGFPTTPRGWLVLAGMLACGATTGLMGAGAILYLYAVTANGR
jgi:hypothetical protein